MKKIISFYIAISFCTLAFATMATPEILTHIQPDGTCISYRLIGDEYAHLQTTLDGYVVESNAEGALVYEGTNTLAHNANTRSAQELQMLSGISKGKATELLQKQMRKSAQQQQVAATFPLTGSPKCLVILVEFTDLKFSTKDAKQAFNNMLNQEGYNKDGAIGSCRDYFRACSYGKFTPQIEAFGPFTVSHNYSFYGANSGSSDKNVKQMIEEACELCAESGVKLADYDNDKNGILDNVFVYYAGHNEAEGASANHIWPHRSSLGGGIYVDGIQIYDYACTSELKGANGTSMAGIGTFCHEFSHVLGLSDVYNTDNSNDYTIGTWDLMANGNYNGGGKTPPTHTAGERFMLGWIKPEQLKEAGAYTLAPSDTCPQVYLIAATDHNLSWSSPSPSEYFLLENRQHVGWDEPSTSLPGTGMLVWHVDYNAGAWSMNNPNNGNPKRYHLEEANGNKGYSNAGDPYPGTAKVTQFSPMLHNGTVLDMPIVNISVNENIVSFTYKSDDNNKLIFLPGQLPTLQATYNSSRRESTFVPQLVQVRGEKLDVEQPITIKATGTGFYISKNQIGWVTELTYNAEEDSSFQSEIYVKYEPRKQVCDIRTGTLTAKNGSSMQVLNLKGTSPRPVLISQPKISKIAELTPYSFKVYWQPEKDAEAYYVTLYTLTDGEESTTESFEKFGKETGIVEAGWDANFCRTSSTNKQDGSYAVWFQQTDEQLTSPTYVQPITKLSTWLGAPATDEDEVGYLYLEANNGEEWTHIDTIAIKRTTKKYTYEKEFDEFLGYIQFRFTYKEVGGKGVCIDAFKATCNKKTIYTYKQREKTIEADPNDTQGKNTMFYASDLIPNTTYYVQLQCSEDKGCSENLTPLTVPLQITTLPGEDPDSKKLTYDAEKHTVYLPEATNSGMVYVYSVDGQLVFSTNVEPTNNVVFLPVEQWRKAETYIVKYAPNDKLARKAPAIKIVVK